jgi:long-chain fatty acid transport protein
MDAGDRVLTPVLRFCVLVLALAPSVASAQAMDTYGMGSRSVALAGAVSADVQDGSANYYNPAGIVRTDKMRIMLGWFGAAHDMYLNDLPSRVDPVHGLVLGLNVPGEIDGFRFGFGLGLHLNDQRVSRTRTLPRSRPRWELYDNRPHRAYLATHVAIQPWPWLRIGGGVGFLSYSTNELRVRGSIDILQPETRSMLEHDLTGELITIRWPQIGVQVQPLPNLNFGATYRGEFALDTSLTAIVGEEDGVGPNATTIGAGPIIADGYFELFTQSVNAYQPHQIAIGASWEPIPEVRIGIDLTILLWSMYRSPIGNASVRLEIDVPPELEGMIMIPGSFPVLTEEAANFSDRVVPRIGVEVTPYRTRDIVVRTRAGYFYENSPAPEQMDYTNLVDTDRHAFSLGLGMDVLSLRPVLPGWLSFDAHFMYGYLPDRTMIKSSPIDAVGDYVARGHVFAGGLTIEAGFE